MKIYKSITSLFLSAFVCTALVLPPAPVAAQENSAEANERIDIDISISINGFDILDSIKSVAREGVRTATRIIRQASNIPRNISRGLRTKFRIVKRGATRIKRKLQRQKDRFKRLARRVLAIARSGGDVPEPLARQTGISAGQIIQLQSEVALLRFELEQLKAQAQLEKLQNMNRNPGN